MPSSEWRLQLIGFTIQERRTVKEIIRKLTDKIGKESLEFGLRDDLSDNMNLLEEFYTSSKLEYINSKGRQKTTAFARVKDVNAVIQEIIRGRGIKRPLVALGLDSGQGKLVVTMAVYDRDELEGLQGHQEVEPHLQQEDVQHEKVLFLLQGALIILSKKNEAQEVTHPGAGGADNLQQEDRRHEQALPQQEVQKVPVSVADKVTGTRKQKSILSVFGELRKLKSKKWRDRDTLKAAAETEPDSVSNQVFFNSFQYFTFILMSDFRSCKLALR